MFGVTHLSRDDRKRAFDIRESLNDLSLSSKERQQLETELREIEAQRKPLNQCTMEECEETKAVLYDHYFKLMRIGRSDLAEQYRRMLVQVDSRIQTINIEISKSEAEKRSKEQEKSGKENRGKSRGKSPSKSRSSKWSIDLSGLD